MNRKKRKKVEERLKGNISAALEEIAPLNRLMFSNSAAAYSRHAFVFNNTMKQFGITNIRMPAAAKALDAGRDLVASRYEHREDWMPKIGTEIVSRKQQIGTMEFGHAVIMYITCISGNLLRFF